MLTRQKALLAFFRHANRPVHRLELTKWAFLLKHDSPSQGGSSFYDFVPYHYGPFSFGLYQELGKLQDQGFVVQVDDHHWSLGTQVANSALNTLDGEIGRIVRKYRSKSTDDLLDEVYERFPAFTVNSKRLQLAKRPEAQLAVYTSGYEGLSIDGFLNRLVQTGIRHLVDVRRNPIARRYGFHKSTLTRLCQSLEIQYSHLPELGIASEKRRNLETQDDYETLFADYRRTTLVDERHALARVAELARKSSTVLVCMEAQPRCCHRSHLAESVAKSTHLSIQHLI